MSGRGFGKVLEREAKRTKKKDNTRGFYSEMTDLADQKEFWSKLSPKTKEIVTGLIAKACYLGAQGFGIEIEGVDMNSEMGPEFGLLSEEELADYKKQNAEVFHALTELAEAYPHSDIPEFLVAIVTLEYCLKIRRMSPN